MSATSVSTSWSPSLVAACCLDQLPGRQRAVGRAEQAALRLRVTVRVHLVLTDEHLVRRVRGVRLAEVHPRRVGVDRLVDVVGRPDDVVRAGLLLAAGQHHEAELRRQVVRGAEDVVGAGDQRVVRLQRDDDGAARRVVGDLVEAVVEELAEDREQRVVRRREADVSGHVRDEERLAGRRAAIRRAIGVTGRRVDRAGQHARRRVRLHPHRVAGCGDGRGVVRRLVDDQVADHARLRVEREARVLRVGGGRSTWRTEEAGVGLGRLERRRREPREDRVSCTELLTTGNEVVAGSVDGPEAVRRDRVRHLVRTGAYERATWPGRRRRGRHVRLGDLDLAQDVRQVGRRHGEARAHRGCGLRRGCDAHAQRDHRNDDRDDERGPSSPSWRCA